MRIENSDDEWEVEQTEEAEQEEADVIAYNINYYPSDLTLSGYLDRYKSKQLFVPDFQREYIWDQVKASKLIESFLLGLPVPGVFLYKQRESNKLMVIDGQQRILSAIRFFTGRFGNKVFTLKKVKPRWEGRTFEELAEPDRFQLQDAVLRATIIQQLDPEDDSSVYHIFERLNTGGVNLNPMEIRKCVYHGEYYLLLEKINKSDEWQEVLGRSAPDKRFRDVELLLRVHALARSWNQYAKPMKKFLNDEMLYVNKLDTEARTEYLDKLEGITKKVISSVYNELDTKPFHLKGRLNYAVLDSVLGILVRHQGNVPSTLNNDFSALIETEKYIDCCTRNTSDEKTLKERFKLVEKHLFGG